MDIFALYGDQQNLNEVFHGITESDCTNSTLKKNDVIALHKRKEGNSYFGRHQWKDAMELYNESLCFSENGLEQMSLAYANRSACFFNLKMYIEKQTIRSLVSNQMKIFHAWPTLWKSAKMVMVI